MGVLQTTGGRNIEPRSCGDAASVAVRICLEALPTSAPMGGFAYRDCFEPNKITWRFLLLRFVIAPPTVPDHSRTLVPRTSYPATAIQILRRYIGERTRSRWHSSAMASKRVALELDRPQAAGISASSSKRSFGKPGMNQMCIYMMRCNQRAKMPSWAGFFFAAWGRGEAKASRNQARVAIARTANQA